MTACFGYKNKDSKRRSLRMKTLSIIFISARCERAVSTCKNAPWSDKGTLSRVRERTPRLLPLDLARKMTRKPLSRRSPYLSWTRRPFTILSNFDRFLSDLTDYFEKKSTRDMIESKVRLIPFQLVYYCFIQAQRTLSYFIFARTGSFIAKFK